MYIGALVLASSFQLMTFSLELLNIMLHKRHKEESKTIWQGNIVLCPSNRDNHSAKAYRC